MPYRREPNQVVVDLKPSEAHRSNSGISSKACDEEADAQQSESLDSELLSCGCGCGLRRLLFGREWSSRHSGRIWMVRLGARMSATARRLQYISPV